ncbi:hypothetical protein LSH36_1205g00103 [Paralvinella palmiformis]|uniref:tRNA (guanine(10)-N(2))-methyltransferase TRMT11 n=1 Tax=Paralvinella palmiformis TaxID=53620 RepID=A0AAD9MP57_9ANNE|nr:hypothetical protein LSH36_1205g00103 [Paralvinella palmiformis]
MAAPVVSCRKYLVQFAHEHLDFRIPELLAVADIFGTTVTIPEAYDKENPYLVVDLPSDEIVKKIASRTILVKSFYQLWAQGHSYDELFHQLRELPHALMAPYLNKNNTFRVIHDSFNKQLVHREKVALIEKLIGESGIEFPGNISLKSPDYSFHLLEYYKRDIPTSSPELPDRVYFGRWITDGHRDVIKQFDLKNRKVIGNTSMDAALALIMANMGHVTTNKIVYDPFVGTGSLLVASAHYGSYVMGTEIDWKLLHGRGRSSRAKQKWRTRDENIHNNLCQYHLGDLYLDVMVADASRHMMWHQIEMFDAIITDPPYGIREPTKKVGTKKEDVEIPEELKSGHIPSKVTYDLSQILLDLLNFAAKFLVLGGRLVYWLPVYREDYVEDNIPLHPCLKLIGNSEQILKSTVSRRLITMKKVQDYEEKLHLAELPNNHYKDASFREKYFRPHEKGPRNSKPSRFKNNYVKAVEAHVRSHDVTCEDANEHRSDVQERRESSSNSCYKDMAYGGWSPGKA